LTGILAALNAASGIFWPQTGAPVPFTTVHGEQVMLAGRGLYAGDTQMQALTFQGSDVVFLLLVVPALFLAYRAYRGGSWRGGLLLIGLLVTLFYNAVSMLFGGMYNVLFPAYLAIFSVSGAAFLLAWGMMDASALAAQVQESMPERGLAIFLGICGLVLFGLWGSEVLVALVAGRPPAILGPYTTVITYVLDLGVIAPACLLTAILLLRRAPLGYKLTPPLLVICCIIGLLVIGQTVAQISQDIWLPMGQLIGFVGSFVVLASISAWLLWRFLTAIREPNTPQKSISAKA
jgi:hypothetical protein